MVISDFVPPKVVFQNARRSALDEMHILQLCSAGFFERVDALDICGEYCQLTAVFDKSNNIMNVQRSKNQK